MAEQTNPIDSLRNAIVRWLQQEGTARSTLAGAIVVLDKLRDYAPLSNKDIFTSGGQLVGGRGEALRNTLARNGETRVFLADGVTTRSTEKFRRLAEAIDYGKALAPFPDARRESAVIQLVEPVLHEISNWFERQHMTITCDRGESPVTWVEQILESSHSKSGGRVEQHLVGAKLELRFPGQRVDVHAAFAADVQTQRSGDFVVGDTVYHVTASPAPPVVRKSADNLSLGLHPVLLVPRNTVERARGLANYEGIDKKVSIFAIEDFVGQNLMEVADSKSETYFEVLRAIVDIYNRRIEEAETDASLRINLR